MAPIPVWSGNRLSLVLVAVRIPRHFDRRHDCLPNDPPINYLKGIDTDRGFKKVPERQPLRKQRRGLIGC
jgi:hypothetical protein